MSLRYVIVEQLPDGTWRSVRKWDGMPAAFRDPMTAGVLADGLRHAGRKVRVIKLDPSCEVLSV